MNDASDNATNNQRRMRVLVSGRVQGVFFRDSTRERAEALGLSGWVRNLPDGTVEAVFEGDGDRVGEMVSWCETGPPDAEVRNVSAETEEPENLRGFEVR
ncbi:acylphosphatase [Rubrobacter marinus]|uniref:Acylphosphatase n=1 Tax=Rubrobacter marinus TaxID=2653852 RepID=A0A6G8PZ94_9ACTN|nr:acylphosphatase [Rubrobacter marinus]QIN79505.1 acylphosphatase [Rubrobacter marinus]